MARANNPGFVFSSTHEPVELSIPLWKLQNDQPEVFGEIVRQLKVSAADFRKLIAELDSSALVSAEAGVEPATFMTNCCAANLSFGWLLQVCLNHLPFGSEIVTLLRDLQVESSSIFLL